MKKKTQEACRFFKMSEESQFKDIFSRNIFRKATKVTIINKKH